MLLPETGTTEYVGHHHDLARCGGVRRTPSRSTFANLDCTFVKNCNVLIKLRGPVPSYHLCPPPPRRTTTRYYHRQCNSLLCHTRAILAQLWRLRSSLSNSRPYTFSGIRKLVSNNTHCFKQRHQLKHIYGTWFTCIQSDSSWSI